MRLNRSRFVLLGMLLAFVLTAGAIIRLSSGGIVAVGGSATARPIVIVDAGHGGVDGGAVGIDGAEEKHINLAISQRLCTMLELGGFEVVMVRETDISIHDSSALTIRQKKVSDLQNRLAITESYPGAILISIHQNKFTVEKYWGTQVFYGPGHESSKVLAELIQNSVISDLQPENTRRTKKADKNLFLLYHAQIPSVLVECGFMSNEEENKRLQDPAYQDALAFSIYSAIVEYTG